MTSGDKLDDLSDRLHVLRRMMAAAGDAAVYDDDLFEIGRMDHRGQKHIICVFNHSDDIKSIAVPLNTRKLNVCDLCDG